MDSAERDKVLKERWTAHMNADFDGFRRPEATISAEERQTQALEYLAYQSGQIRKALDRLIDAVAAR